MVELVCGGQPRRAGAYHSHLLPGPLGWAAAFHSLLGVGILNDAQFIVPYGHAVAVHAADTGLLAGRGAHPARELREIVGLQQTAQGVEGVIRPNHVVPLGNQVVKGTAEGPSFPLHSRLAVGHAAVHAPAPLLPPDRGPQGDAEGLPVPDPFLRRAAGGLLPVILQKSSCFSHIGGPP